MKFVLAFTCLIAMTADAQTVRKRAVIIGIDDYTASTIPKVRNVEHRGWPDLRGAARDAQLLRELLTSRYGFATGDVVTLLNQRATRVAILRAIDDLVNASRKGDVAFFYFAGHGSQIPNSLSDELDRLDESIVPADSRRGAPDIRDKELRTRFNAILDRGTHLTLLLDHCNSGSSFRGSPRTRSIQPATTDVRDRTDYGPRPETRGALVIAAAQDNGTAWESLGDDDELHGDFTWAFLHALRDATPHESAQQTFLRAHARMRAEHPDQQPVLAGTSAARNRPFLDTRLHLRDRQSVVAIERVDANGTVVVQGGWANGLAIGSILKTRDNASRLVVTRLLGIHRSVARIERGRVTAGAMLEVSSWAAPPSRPLRVWSQSPLTGIIDSSDGFQIVATAADADYILASKGQEHAWIRTGARNERSAWIANRASLRESALTLRKIHGWRNLESPPGPAAPYRLALQREADRSLVTGNTLIGGERYRVVLQGTNRRAPKRYYYAFVIDSHGKSFLAFPQSSNGSVENRFPLGEIASTITLGDNSVFEVKPPYGADLFFLLSTEEPLPNPSVLDWDGIRAGRTLTTSAWSIERAAFESVPPRKLRR
ncbi:MAG TPA: caspase family protein [Thermoanaerobaculia bacterium]